MIWGQSSLDSAQYYLDRSEFKQARHYFQQWIDDNEPGTEEYINVMMDFAMTLKLQTEYGKSLQLYLDILNGRYGDLNRRQEIAIRVGIGELYRSVNKIQRSVQILNSANLSEADLRKYPAASAAIFHRLSACYNQRNILDSAVYFSLRSMQISRENDLRNAMSISFNEIANIYEKQQMLDSAKYYYDQACNFWNEKGELRFYSNAFFNRARVTFHEGKLDSARILLEQNLNSIQEKDWPEVKGPIYFYLKQIYYQKGDSIQGLKYEIENIRSDILVERKNQDKNLLDLEAKYKSKEKDRQLEVRQMEIQRKEAEIEERNKRLFLLVISLILVLVILVLIALFAIRSRSRNNHLKKLLVENQFLLAESNHRIKNNLQLITSLIMQETDKYSGNDRKILLELSNKIESISMLHKQIYLEESKEKIDLMAYFRAIKENYYPFLKEKNVNCSLKLDEVKMDIDRSLYFGLLLSELISNSLKHAFAAIENPEIKIQLTAEKDQIVFEYSDNGIGLEQKSPQLVELMCLQLKGKYSMTNEHGFTLNLQVKK